MSNNHQQEWLPGDWLPVGLEAPHPLTMGIKGVGVVGDPGISWNGLCPINRIGQERIDACEDIVRSVALRYGFAFAIIRSENHRQRKERNAKTGRLVPGGMVKADPHITVYFGTDFHHCQVQGHIYVIEEGDIPIRIARPDEREIIFERENRVSIELWICRAQGMQSVNRLRTHTTKTASPPRGFNRYGRPPSDSAYKAMTLPSWRRTVPEAVPEGKPDENTGENTDENTDAPS